jgi:hypothetical protein
MHNQHAATQLVCSVHVIGHRQRLCALPKFLQPVHPARAVHLLLLCRFVSKVLTFLTGLVGRLVGEALADAGGGGGSTGGRYDSE